MFLPRTLPLILAVNSFFEGEDPGAGGGGGTQAPPPKTFTQDDVNRIVADRINEENRKYQQQMAARIKELETLKNQATTTAEQKTALQNQIDQLQSTFATKEQQLQREVEGWEKKYKTETESLSTQANQYKTLYESNVKNVAIVNAATQYKAFNPSQIDALLAPLTQVVEEVGEDGKPTGRHAPQVTFPTVDKTGKPVTLRLSVNDAVKMMTEMPDQYGNLFRSEANSGIGGGTTGGRGAAHTYTAEEVETMDMADYIKDREKIRGQAK